MNSFTILILLLLILSIANNLVMYHKCYISKNLIYDAQNNILNQALDSNIGVYSANIYYTKNNLPTQCSNGNSSENVIIGDIKNILTQFENKNKNKCVITYGSPTSYDYEKIKLLATS